jgi:M6 family metalloprotease-like protein
VHLLSMNESVAHDVAFRGVRAGRVWVLILSCVATLARADFMDHFVVREDVGPHKAPYVGDSKIVLIPIEVAGFPPLDMAAIERFFAADEPTGFVSFYETASVGRYHPQVGIAPKVSYATCPLPAASFPRCAVKRGDLNAFAAGMDMIRDVMKKTDEAGFDFSSFDVNGRKGVADGWLDGVMLLTNVPFGGIAFPFSYFNRGDNLSGGNGGPLMVDGLKAGHFAIAGEGKVLVMLHESGHLLGLSDLYDESRRYEGLNLSWMGAWHYDANIPLPDAETRFRLRWAQWNQVQGRARVVIPPVEQTGDVYRLGVGDEYFLIENRGPEGTFDRGLPERGLAVFHVDRTVKLGGLEGDFVNRILDCVNCDPFHPYIRLVQADGKFEVEAKKPFGPGDLFTKGGSLLPVEGGQALSADHQVNSTNFYSGAASGFRIEDIVVRADHSIEVTLEAPAAAQCDERLCAEGEGCAAISCTKPNTGCQVGAGLVPGLAFLLLEKRLRRRHQGFFGRA